MGGDPSAVLQQAPSGSQPPMTQQAPQNDEAKRFVSLVLGDTEKVWHQLLAQNGRSYREPKLVLFNAQVRSACGIAGSSTGPFYCPADEKIYIDLDFYRDLRDRYQAPGDFAQAYVIAHEVGHHLQKQLGTMQKVHNLQSRMSKTQANQLSVKLELQADFYAGVWAHYAARRGILEAGDVEEGLRAASAIGDDKLQLESQGYVVPDSFTHGSSAQRIQWFRKGLESGDLSKGNTFNAEAP
jgi:predicted metalloprotease